MVFVVERLRFDFIQQHRAAEHQIKINGFKLIVLHERYLEVHFPKSIPPRMKKIIKSHTVSVKKIIRSQLLSNVPPTVSNSDDWRNKLESHQPRCCRSKIGHSSQRAVCRECVREHTLDWINSPAVIQRHKNWAIDFLKRGSIVLCNYPLIPSSGLHSHWEDVWRNVLPHNWMIFFYV